MKRLLNISLLLAAVLICLFALSTDAKAAGLEDLSYSINGDTVTITDCNESASGELVIPGTIEGYPVVAIDHQAFANCYNLTGIVVPDSVTSIGWVAFADSYNLASISLPDNVTIAESAFLNTAYYNDESNWENGVLYIGKHLVDTTPTLSGSCTIKAGTIAIAEGAFTNRTGLTSVVFPNGLTKIGAQAFWGCSGLTCITIPDSVTEISGNSFNECTNLKKLIVAEDSEYVTSTMVVCKSQLTEVTLPNSVHYIDDGAFEGCTGLTEITIPNGVREINPHAFKGCTGLTEITIPSSVTRISQAFVDCTGLTSVTILDGPSSIEIVASAFKGCTNLRSVIILKRVNLLGSGVFSRCDQLWHVLYSGTEEQWNDCVMENSLPAQTTIHYECTGNEELDTEAKRCSICMATCSHNWGEGWVCINDADHARSCSLCHKEETKNHAYDGACDAQCDDCGTTRNISHSYETAWSNDKNQHWYSCSVCGDKKELGDHTPGAPATESTAQTCTTCGYIIMPVLNHAHNYSDALTSNHEGHWFACDGCSEQKDYAAHVYGNACDTDCNSCGYVRTITHSYTTEWSKDADNHWHTCSVCGDIQDLAAHTPGADATICVICGYEAAPAAPSEPAATEPESGNVDLPQPKFPWWIILVGGIVITGIILLLVWKAKASKR